jgi:hypothetical protein
MILTVKSNFNNVLSNSVKITFNIGRVKVRLSKKTPFQKISLYDGKDYNWTASINSKNWQLSSKSGNLKTTKKDKTITLGLSSLDPTYPLTFT